ncbi:hypothetical protein L0337_05295 [candidate division KSB1 bacterium]|nr:hypothetical protein [candidate division KSB1 bacterium]
MNRILGLKARPNESFNAAFQPGQANAAVGLKSVTAANRKKMANFAIFLI